MYDEAKQIEILLTPVADNLLEDLRKSLITIAGSTEEKAARRLLGIIHDTALKGLLSDVLEDLETEETDFISMKIIFEHMKLSTPPVPALRGKLQKEGLPHILASKVMRYADFLNFKHHIAALAICFLLLYRLRT